MGGGWGQSFLGLAPNLSRKRAKGDENLDALLQRQPGRKMQSYSRWKDKNSFGTRWVNQTPLSARKNSYPASLIFCAST